jgi:SAM-dependent methyltransferase
MAAHTHDGIDWPMRLEAMSRADAIDAEVDAEVAERLVGLVAPGATVVDVGPGAGGMSAALASALAARGGGRIVLVDAVPELLAAASANVERALAGAAAPVELSAVRIDAASGDLADVLPPVDLVWASGVVHHLPDQLKGISVLAKALAPGGWLALAEGGLPTRCLPWDVGVGEPGLVDRLAAAQKAWFADMRAAMPGVTRLPVGWTRALSDVGLGEVSSFSMLTDHPAPASEVVRRSVVDHLAWCAGVAAERLSEPDQVAIARLLDPDDPAFVGARDDVFVLGVSTVHLGRKAAG